MDSNYKAFLIVAREEIETLIKYSDYFNEMPSDTSEDTLNILREVMSDELNHALIALLTASHYMDIPIATDDLEPNPNDIEVNEGEDDNN